MKLRNLFVLVLIAALAVPVISMTSYRPGSRDA